MMVARRVLWSPEIPRDMEVRCALLTRYIATKGRECFRRCEIHYRRQLQEDQFLGEMMDAKFFVIPYIELQVPVSPWNS